MKSYHLLVGGVLFLCLAGLYSCQIFQATSEKEEAMSPAEEAFSRGLNWRNAGKTNRAIVAFREAIGHDSTYAKAWFRLAELYDQTGQNEAMMHALDQFVQLEATPPDAAYFKLGETAFQLDQFEHAEEYLMETQPENLSDRQRERRHQLIRNSRFAQTAIRDTQEIDPQKLPPSINTDSHDEYWPVLLPDKSAFYFTRRVGNNEEFFVSKPMGDSFSVARPVIPLNTERNEGAMALSPNGNWMVFTWCNVPNGWGRCDLYITFFRDSTWSDPINLGPEINTEAWESGPTLGNNGDVLYYASSKSGGKGGSDIYKAVWQEDNMWGNPENLGDSVNSSGKEQSPFLHPDGQTLYFRSNGWPGMGGFDLFVSRKKEDGGWTRPRNLGIPINTKDDEGSLFVGLDGKTAFFASDGFAEKGLQQSSVDIYTFELPEEARAIPSTYVRLFPVDADSLTPVEATISMIDLETRDTVYIGKQQAGESKLFCVPAYHTYAVHVTSPNYVFHSKHIALDTLQTAFDPIRDTILMQRVFAGADTTAIPTILQNVFFEYDKSKLLSESKVELDQLYRFLKEHSKLEITIRGHTDNIGSADYNQQLSEERAKAVYDYLVESGIEPERMKYRGMGEREPIADNDTYAGRKQNRRTDFVIRRE